MLQQKAYARTDENLHATSRMTADMLLAKLNMAARTMTRQKMRLKLTVTSQGKSMYRFSAATPGTRTTNTTRVVYIA